MTAGARFSPIQEFIHRLALSCSSVVSSAINVEYMFDSLVSAALGSRAAAAVGAWARVENAACARRLFAMADELERHAGC